MKINEPKVMVQTKTSKCSIVQIVAYACLMYVCLFLCITVCVCVPLFFSIFFLVLALVHFLKTKLVLCGGSPFFFGGSRDPNAGN